MARTGEINKTSHATATIHSILKRDCYFQVRYQPRILVLYTCPPSIFQWRKRLFSLSLSLFLSISLNLLLYCINKLECACCLMVLVRFVICAIRRALRFFFLLSSSLSQRKNTFRRYCQRFHDTLHSKPDSLSVERTNRISICAYCRTGFSTFRNHSY